MELYSVRSPSPIPLSIIGGNVDVKSIDGRRFFFPGSPSPLPLSLYKRLSFPHLSPYSRTPPYSSSPRRWSSVCAHRPPSTRPRSTPTGPSAPRCSNVVTGARPHSTLIVPTPFVDSPPSVEPHRNPPPTPSLVRTATESLHSPQG